MTHPDNVVPLDVRMIDGLLDCGWTDLGDMACKILEIATYMAIVAMRNPATIVIDL